MDHEKSRDPGHTWSSTVAQLKQIEVMEKVFSVQRGWRPSIVTHGHGHGHAVTPVESIDKPRTHPWNRVLPAIQSLTLSKNIKSSEKYGPSVAQVAPAEGGPPRVGAGPDQERAEA